LISKILSSLEMQELSPPGMIKPARSQNQRPALLFGQKLPAAPDDPDAHALRLANPEFQ
jgi:hypothetical protein